MDSGGTPGETYLQSAPGGITQSTWENWNTIYIYIYMINNNQLV